MAEYVDEVDAGMWPDEQVPECDGCATKRFVGRCESCSGRHCPDCAMDINHVIST